LNRLDEFDEEIARFPRFFSMYRRFYRAGMPEGAGGIRRRARRSGHLVLPVMRLYDQGGPVSFDPLHARVGDSMKMTTHLQEKELQVPALETRGQNPVKNPAGPPFQILRPQVTISHFVISPLSVGVSLGR